MDGRAGGALAGTHYQTQIATTQDYLSHPNGGQQEVVWTYSISQTGSVYVALHFTTFDLGPTDYLKLSDGNGGQSVILRGNGRRDGKDFWSPRINGEKMVLELVCDGPQRGKGFVVDKYSAGLPHPAKAARPKSLCGFYIDEENVACYAGTIYQERSKPVARVLVHSLEGDFWGTGFLVSQDNYFLTAQHVISTEAEAASVEIEFFAEAPFCSSRNCEGCWPGPIYYGAEFVRSSAQLDYTLVRITSGNPAAAAGFLELESRAPILGERIYIPQHPLGLDKQIVVYDFDTGAFCKIESLSTTTCQGIGGDVGYYADTDGGSSGAPVIASSSHRVIALHHCGGCLNTGVPMQRVWNEVACYLRPKSISVNDWDAPGEGATRSVKVTAGTGCKWTISNPCTDWITTSVASGSGTLSVSVTVKPNISCVARYCTLTIAEQAFTVGQSAKPAGVSATKFSLPAGGGFTNISISDQSACGWVIENYCDWLNPSTAEGAGNGVLSISAGPNLSGVARSCGLNVAEIPVLVNQLPCTYSISPVAVNLPPAETNGSVRLTTSAGCPWEASTTDSWITINSATGGTNATALTYSVTANLSFVSRTGVIHVAGGSFTIVQDGDRVRPNLVAITNPPAGFKYTNAQTVRIYATGRDNVGVTGVEFYDGGTLQGMLDTAPYYVDWSFDWTKNGAHTWTVRAYDATGNISTSAPVVLNVSIPAPMLSILAPVSGRRWSNEVFEVQGKASGYGGVQTVYYRVNNEEWLGASTANGWSNWTATVGLTPGTNTIRAYALDLAGHLSSTSSVSFVYVLSAPVAVSISGNGKVTPNYNGQLLEIGKNYTMTAAPGAGFVFTNWSGSLGTNRPALTFLMASNLELTASFVDIQRPTLQVSSPVASQRLSNELFTVQGKTGDNGQIASVYCQLNSGDWLPTATTNRWTNWSTAVTLNPGTNRLRAYALDLAGNLSPTGTVSFFYVVRSTVVVSTSGKGTVSPNYNGQLLEIGRNYTMTATPAAGFAFTNWSGTLGTNRPGLTFLMSSNLDLTAKFVDIQRPTVAVGSPLVGQRLSNSVVTVQGRAGDNGQLAGVYYQLNSGDWLPAETGNNWSNWTVTATLDAGTNRIRAYSVDTAGNLSSTGAVSFFYVVPAPIAVGINGKGTVTPNYNGQLLEIGRNYTMTAVPGAGFAFTNWSGTVGTNRAALTFLMTSNLELTANFVDVQRPTLQVISPVAGQRFTNSLVTVRGKAGDNGLLALVWCRLNSNEWFAVSSTNNWTNWMADLPLSQSNNVLQAYAIDAAGNASPTSRVAFVTTSIFELRLRFGSVPGTKKASQADPKATQSSGLELILEVPPGVSGRIEVSTNLQRWEEFEAFSATNSAIRFHLPRTGAGTQRFYRARVGENAEAQPNGATPR